MDVRLNFELFPSFSQNLGHKKNQKKSDIDFEDYFYSFLISYLVIECNEIILNIAHCTVFNERAQTSGKFSSLR